MYPNRFEYGTHGTTGNYARTMCCWLDQHSACIEFPVSLMWDGSVEDRNFDQIFFSVFHSLGNSLRHLTSLTQALTDGPFAIPYHYHSSEGKCTTTFGDFGHAIERDEFLFEARFFAGTRNFFFSFLPCHVAKVVYLWT